MIELTACPTCGTPQRQALRQERPECGLWMPYAKEFCARMLNHRGTCRTRYAMDCESWVKARRRAA